MSEIPLLGPDGLFDSRAIRLIDLKGNISVHPEADETFPRLKSQQRAVLQQLFSVNDPAIQRALVEPANLGYIKNVLGLTELVIPGEDSRNKQLREIQQLLTSPPIVVPVQVPDARDPRFASVPPSQASARSANVAAESDVGTQHAAPQPGEMSAEPRNSFSRRSPSTNSSTITPPNSRSANAGQTPTPAKPRT